MFTMFTCLHVYLFYHVYFSFTTYLHLYYYYYCRDFEDMSFMVLYRPFLQWPSMANDRNETDIN